VCAGGQFSGEGFEVEADGGDLAPVRVGEWAHHEGVSWSGDEEAFVFESDECFPDGDAADAEGFGEGRLGKGDLFGDFAVEDSATDFGEDLIGDGESGDGEGGGDGGRGRGSGCWRCRWRGC
jgi:hypothetical protein